MLQNGQMPVFLDEEILQSMKSTDATNQCIVQIQTGLQTLGMVSVRKASNHSPPFEAWIPKGPDCMIVTTTAKIQVYRGRI